MLRFPRQARWLAPVGVVAAVAAVAAGTLVSVAQAAPSLPRRTPAQLLADIAAAPAPAPPLTGTLQQTSGLGIPQIPGMDSQSSIASLLTGSHKIMLWYGGPGHVRLALPVPMGETDLIRNGSTAWLWQSASDSVTKFSLPAKPASTPPAVPSLPAVTPRQAAQQILAAVGPSTQVRLNRNVMVAGQPAYELVLAPRSPASLIGSVRIDLDGAHPQLPLRVQVFARGAAAPAFSVAFTSLSFTPPPASTFRFAPPRGARVHQVAQLGTAVPGPVGMPVHVGAAAVPAIIGKGWLTVAVLPASVLSSFGPGNAAGAAGQAARSLAGGNGGGGGLSTGALLAGLLRSATPVHGSWGSGRLIHTSLLNVLITSSGHVLVGAVSRSVLFAAAARVK
jgi:outer membrane lipoprotein-sorting protein